MLTLRNELLDTLWADFQGVSLEGTEYDRFYKVIYEALPGKIHEPTLEDSLSYLAGRSMSREDMSDLCWRLAGNLRRLKARRSVLPWRVQRALEWVPLHITACRRLRRGKKRGALFTFKVLAGTPCPLSLQIWWSSDQCFYVASRFGFTPRGSPNAKNAPRYPYSVPEQLVSMRLYGLIEPVLSESEPSFRQILVPPSARAHNRIQVRRRARIDPGYVCPENYRQDFPCQRCPVGYLRCPAGTHRQDWVAGPCSNCNKSDAFFDPESPAKVCVSCTIRIANKESR